MNKTMFPDILRRNFYGRRAFDDVGKRFSNQISITAETAVGKSDTISAMQKLLPQNTFTSIGAKMRERQKELGFKTIEEFTTHMRFHPEEGHDEAVDSEFCRRALVQNLLVGEGRLVHVFMPYAFHVLLICHPFVRAQRRWKAWRKKDPKLKQETVLGAILDRDRDDESRYEENYPGCIWDKSDYDLVVSTEYQSQEQVARKIVEGHQIWFGKFGRNSKQIIAENWI